METRSSPSVGQLHKMASDRGLSQYNNLGKTQLFQLLISDTCLDNADNCKESDKDGALDPIMLTPLGPHVYNFTRPNGSVIRYNVESLVQYFLTSGRFNDPESNIPFTNEQLAEVDELLKSSSNSSTISISVLDAKLNHSQKYAKERTERDGLMALDRCAGDCVSQMLQVIEGRGGSDGEIYLVTTLFPTFIDLYNQLSNLDEEYAAQCMDHYVEFIKGPPNNRTKSNDEYLNIILDFLSSVSNKTTNVGDYGY